MQQGPLSGPLLPGLGGEQHTHHQALGGDLIDAAQEGRRQQAVGPFGVFGKGFHRRADQIQGGLQGRHRGGEGDSNINARAQFGVVHHLVKATVLHHHHPLVGAAQLRAQ